MNKQKSIFVTALLSVLLLSLNAALYIVARPAFFVFSGFFALIGFLGYAVAFCKWLEKPSEHPQDDLDIIHFKATPHYGEEPGKGYEMTYEQIKQEVEGDL